MRALVVCATYGRIPYLGKMLSGFISQTYDDKHLLIINDDSNIQLCCELNDVTIINCNRRMFISEKRNLGACFGYYDVIFPWDDDDIFYPTRISNHMKQYEDPEVNAYRNYPSYIIYNSIFSPDGGGINNHSYRRSEWFRCGGYGNVGMSGEDVDLHYKLSGFKHSHNEDERDFCYGFSTSNYHLSSTPDWLEKLAYDQLVSMNLLGEKYWIVPDAEQYNTYLRLEEIYKTVGTPLKVKVLDHGNIDISHLL